MRRRRTPDSRDKPSRPRRGGGYQLPHHPQRACMTHPPSPPPPSKPTDRRSILPRAAQRRGLTRKNNSSGPSQDLPRGRAPFRTATVPRRPRLLWAYHLPLLPGHSTHTTAPLSRRRRRRRRVAARPSLLVSSLSVSRAPRGAGPSSGWCWIPNMHRGCLLAALTWRRFADDHSHSHSPPSSNANARCLSGAQGRGAQATEETLSSAQPSSASTARQ